MSLLNEVYDVGICPHCDAAVDKKLCEERGHWQCEVCKAEWCGICGLDHAMAADSATYFQELLEAHIENNKVPFGYRPFAKLDEAKLNWLMEQLKEEKEQRKRDRQIGSIGDPPKMQYDDVEPSANKDTRFNQYANQSQADAWGQGRRPRTA